MPRRKKRPAKEALKNRSDPFSTVRDLLDPSSKAFNLSGFLRDYVPNLQHQVPSVHGDLLLKIVISPLDTLVAAPHISSPDCREPLPSIVEDVAWALVRRRDRLKSRGVDGRNVLIDGYKKACGLDADRAFSSRPGIVNVSQNDNVSFCKSSNLIQQLHDFVGDEVLRMILLNTRLFVPMEQASEAPHSTLITICGPPLGKRFTNPAASGDLEKVATKRRPKKKRRRNVPERTRETEANSVISRSPMFYSNSYVPKIGLSKHHAMNDSNTTGEKLLAMMTNTHNGKGRKRRSRWRRLRDRGVDICDQILKRHKRCDYPRLLSRHCPTPQLPTRNSVSRTSPAAESETLERLGKQHAPPDQVVRFVASVLRTVFPDAFWGCEENYQHVVGVVNIFVSLRRREKLPNKILMHGLATNKLIWLHGNHDGRTLMSRSSHEATTALALRVLRWLFRGFIIPLFRSVFYATETEFTGNQVVYYRKPVWALFRSLSMRKLLRKQFIEIKGAMAIRRANSQVIGYSPLKLLPKGSGVRPIAQLSRKPTKFVYSELAATKVDRKRHLMAPLERRVQPLKKARVEEDQAGISTDQLGNPNSRVTANHMPANAVLKALFDILKYECSRRFQIFGTGLEGLGAFYPRYHKYLADLKQKGSLATVNLVFASVDIEKCYDNICQPFLFDLARSCLSHDDYIIQQFNTLRGQAPGSGRGIAGRVVVSPPETYRPLHDRVSLQSRGGILEPGKCMLAKKNVLLKLLSEHLHDNLLMISGRFGKRFLVQSSGIPQGSILSMLLCNLYYGEIEKMTFNSENPQSPLVHAEATPAHDLMARLVDDFIYISTSQKSASNFLKRMWEGQPDFGVVINRDKILASTSLDLPQAARRGQYRHLRDSVKLPGRSHERQMFPWCGILFDARTGEVTLDYARFPKEEVRNSLTIDRNGAEGEMLRFRMKTFVKPRCLPLFYDSTINSRETIALNYYQMMVFAAIKTAEYLKATISCHGQPVNLDYFLGSIDSMSAFAQLHIRNSLRCQCPDAKRNKFVLGCLDTTWLCWSAFHRVFERIFQNSEIVNRIARQIPAQSCDSKLAAVTRRAFRQMQLQGVVV